MRRPPWVFHAIARGIYVAGGAWLIWLDWRIAGAVALYVWGDNLCLSLRSRDPDINPLIKRNDREARTIRL